MSITSKLFGTTNDGKEVHIFTLKNSNGMIVEIINYGATVLSIFVPDRNGKLDDVALGYDRLEDYYINAPFFGSILGRHANRIANAKFELNGTVYHLNKNEGENHLHGGIKGFHKVVWDAEIVQDDSGEHLKLNYISKDGEEGYPGNLDVTVTYTLTQDDALRIDYYAVSDKDTTVNLTNHTYFNLAGHASGSILKHQLMINADKFTPTDDKSIPTGEIVPVKGTPMDFTALTPIGARIDSKYEQLVFGSGYDHNWCLNVSGKEPEKAAELYEPSTGRVMEVYTTKPGIQFYSGNHLDTAGVGKGGTVYQKRDGLCLETQYYPDCLNHKNFPSSILRAGEEYKHTTIYKFYIR
ncbi:MAG: galactose mutarotase [Clostridiaceae bacterium]|nr:galactose mutarotase [Clostridiaceae bacterium]